MYDNASSLNLFSNLFAILFFRAEAAMQSQKAFSRHSATFSRLTADPDDRPDPVGSGVRHRPFDSKDRRHQHSNFNQQQYRHRCWSIEFDDVRPGKCHIILLKLILTRIVMIDRCARFNYQRSLCRNHILIRLREKWRGYCKDGMNNFNTYCNDRQVWQIQLSTKFLP